VPIISRRAFLARTLDSDVTEAMWNGAAHAHFRGAVIGKDVLVL
jgi:hypothetical protein